MQKVLKEDPLPPSSLNVQAPSGMDAVVRSALAKRPEDRFQTAREFADALRAAAPGRVAGGDRSHAGRRGDATVLAAPMAAATTARAAPAPAAVSVPTEKKSQTAAVAVAIGVAVVAIGAVAWYIVFVSALCVAFMAFVLYPIAAIGGRVSLREFARAALPARTMLISAVGLIDPSDPRYQADKALLQSDLRADSKSQLVEKALGLLLDSNSLARNYDVLKTRLLSQSASFVPAVIKEGEPQLGKDGLMSITTQGVVNVKAVQKSLNQMSRDERIDFIRASGNPKVALQISIRDADAPDAPPQPSPVAENMLKERIKSFGFRTWSEGSAADQGGKNADFLVQGEARVKKLSMQLPASGLTVSKYALTSWTVKCTDRATGEEVYYNTALPKGVGSWASEEERCRRSAARSPTNSRATFPPACQPERTESHAQRGWHAQLPRPRNCWRAS
jgi:serine/threonine-protein kinase